MKTAFFFFLLRQIRRTCLSGVAWSVWTLLKPVLLLIISSKCKRSIWFVCCPMSRHVRVWYDLGFWQLWHRSLALLYWLKKGLSGKQLATVPLFQHHTLWTLRRSLQKTAQLELLALGAWVPRVLVHSWLFQELELFCHHLLRVRGHECKALGGLVLSWLIGANTILHL